MRTSALNKEYGALLKAQTEEYFDESEEENNSYGTESP